MLVVFLAGQGQAHHGQLVDDFLKRLASQVAHLHHLILCLGDQVLDGVDISALEAVEAADTEIQFLDGQLQHLVLGIGCLFHHGGLVAQRGR